jgi:hypothetical protein
MFKNYFKLMDRKKCFMEILAVIVVLFVGKSEIICPLRLREMLRYLSGPRVLQPTM